MLEMSCVLEIGAFFWIDVFDDTGIPSSLRLGSPPAGITVANFCLRASNESSDLNKIIFVNKDKIF